MNAEFFDTKHARTLGRDKNKPPALPVGSMTFLVKQGPEVALDEIIMEPEDCRFETIFVSLHYLFTQ